MYDFIFLFNLFVFAWAEESWKAQSSWVRQMLCVKWTKCTSNICIISYLIRLLKSPSIVRLSGKLKNRILGWFFFPIFLQPKVKQKHLLNYLRSWKTIFLSQYKKATVQKQLFAQYEPQWFSLATYMEQSTFYMFDSLDTNEHIVACDGLATCPRCNPASRPILHRLHHPCEPDQD